MNLPYAADLVTQYIPWYYLVAQDLKAFNLPHWVEGIYGQGYPLLAQGETGALSPVNALILFLFPFPLAVSLLYLTYFLVAFLGTYLFLRLSRLTKTASFLGGLIFILSGFMVTRYFQPSIIFSAALLPLGMAVVKKSYKSGNFIFWLAPLIFLQITAGHLQIAAISTIAYLTYAFLLIIHKKRKIFSLAKIVTVIFLGVGLSALQLFPSVKLFQLSERKTWDPMIRFSYSLPPSHLITYVLPGAYGISQPGDDFGFSQFGGGFWELNLTIWTIPFFLSILPLLTLAKKRKPEILILYLLWFLFLLLAFGGFFKPYWIVAHIPDFPFRAPARFLLVCTFAASCLSAYGFDYLLAKRKNSTKIIFFIIVLISILTQQRLQLGDYFHTQDSGKIMADLSILADLKLTTPLPLDSILAKPDVDSSKKAFRIAFQRGAILSALSLIVLGVWWKVSTLGKFRIR